MATPETTGQISKYVIEKIKADHISQADQYANPELEPGRIADEVLNIAKTSPRSSDYVISVKMLVEGIKKWKPSPNLLKSK